ncbi:MAG: hypothetical protein JXO48_05060 [Deltaproteobacteria bacterium]|nr:hypothetical protein [Deltaproteobacteria bacterium]
MMKDTEYQERTAVPRSRPSARDPEAVAAASQVLKGYPLSEAEQELFLRSDKRINKLLGIDRYKDRRIVVEIEESMACLAGHTAGDRLYFNSAGFLMVDELKKPVCARLLNKIWYRLIMIMDRIADGTADYIGDGRFEDEILEVRMTCYGADFPYGDCGQVTMKVSVE